MGSWTLGKAEKLKWEAWEGWDKWRDVADGLSQIGDLRFQRRFWDYLLSGERINQGANFSAMAVLARVSRVILFSARLMSPM